MTIDSMTDTNTKTTGKFFEIFKAGVAGLFLICIMLVMYINNFNHSQSILIIVSAIVGGYMAINIGANDVANNVGPAVGSKALTLGGAVLIAIFFESAGALLAGGSVVSTIKGGIIDPQLISDSNTFIWLMLAALLAAALWLNFATYIGAPVSTTHSIVGGVLGSGIAAGGWGIANWDQMLVIASSWIISPVIGGVIAAGFLFLIKRQITYQKDKIKAAKKVVPWLMLLMTWAFSSYLIIKGMKKVIIVDHSIALLIGLVIAIVVFLFIRPIIAKKADKLTNSKEDINQLFTFPLIVSAALLCFAHGANDVANAVGPLAAINDSLSGHISSKASIPIWVMIIGASGIVIGVMLYGQKLIKTVGSDITELDKIRAFSIAMAASITVIFATQFGLPVSSTHIALGAIFGVGFLRESIKTHYDVIKLEIEYHHRDKDPQKVIGFMDEFNIASLDKKRLMLKELKNKTSGFKFSKKERKKLKKYYKRVLVQRSALYRIAAAWIITVPASGLIAAFIFYAIRGFMLP